MSDVAFLPRSGKVNPWLTLGEAPPFIADVDLLVLDREHRERYALRCDVLPHVWIGNPSTARVLLLQLNPGFAASDVEEEADIPVYQDVVRQSLALSEGTRFWPLDDRLKATGAARWWRPRLRQLIDAAGEAGVRDHVAVVEYFPYHSTSYRWPPRMPSQHFGFDMVRAAIDAGAVVVVMRQWESWRAAVPELIRCTRVHQNPNPRQAAVSSGNLGDRTFNAILAALG